VDDAQSAGENVFDREGKSHFGGGAQQIDVLPALGVETFDEAGELLGSFGRLLSGPLLGSFGNTVDADQRSESRYCSRRRVRKRDPWPAHTDG
jgi:hypothetical protein